MQSHSLRKVFKLSSCASQTNKAHFSTNRSMSAIAARTTNNNNGKPMRDDGSQILSGRSHVSFGSNIDWHATYAKSVEDGDESKVFDAEYDYSDCGQADLFEDAFGTGAAMRRRIDKEISQGWVNRH